MCKQSLKQYLTSGGLDKLHPFSQHMLPNSVDIKSPLYFDYAQQVNQKRIFLKTKKSLYSY